MQINNEVITTICAGAALLIGALITPFINLIKDIFPKKDEAHIEEEYVTKCELEVKHREIMEEVGRKFASNDTVIAMQGEFKEIKGKLDKIYDLLINKAGGM